MSDLRSSTLTSDASFGGDEATVLTDSLIFDATRVDGVKLKCSMELSSVLAFASAKI